MPRGKYIQFVKGQVLKQYDNGTGYLRVGFNVNGKYIRRYVHRIVAQTFIPNPDNLPEANHKGNNPANNCVSNLEWCTHEYNIEYREKYGKSAKDFIPKSPVFAVNLKTYEVLWFESQHEASRELGVSQGHVWGVIKGQRKQTGGYWFVKDDIYAVDVAKNILYNIIGNKIKDLTAENSSNEVVNFVTKCLM